MIASPLTRIVALRIVTEDGDRLAHFYADALGAQIEGVSAIGAADLALLGVSGGTRWRLRVGGFAIEIDRFDEPGEAYPADANAADLRFQHFAAVVDDMTTAFDRAIACGATLISQTGPVALPAAAGGVVAVKLRDPDGHPFELLRFPADADTVWRESVPNGRGILGIDHSAIVVADASRSRAFYAAAGLAARGGSINRGPTQIALDGLALDSVDVVPLFPAIDRPHLELLGYHGIGQRSTAVAQVVDIAATRTVWAADRAALLRDPDGHLHELRSEAD